MLGFGALGQFALGEYNPSVDQSLGFGTALTNRDGGGHTEKRLPYGWWNALTETERSKPDVQVRIDKAIEDDRKARVRLAEQARELERQIQAANAQSIKAILQGIASLESEAALMAQSEAAARALAYDIANMKLRLSMLQAKRRDDDEAIVALMMLN